MLTDVREGNTLLTDLWFEAAAVRHAGKVDAESLAWAEARDADFGADLIEGFLLRLYPNFLLKIDGDLDAGRGDLFNGVFHIQNLFSFCN